MPVAIFTIELDCITQSKRNSQ